MERLWNEGNIGFLQEWASQNHVAVPHKEGRVNASQLYKGGDDDLRTNILQVSLQATPTCGQSLGT